MTTGIHAKRVVTISTILFLTLIFSRPTSIIHAAPINLGSSGLTKIWAIDDSEKIKKTDIGGNVRKDQNGVPFPESPNNAAWKDNTVHLFGGKNEMVAFQLIMESTGGASGISVGLDKLTGPNNFVLTNKADNNNDPYNYVGKHIEIFTPIYTHSNSKYSYYTGQLPEMMIPAMPANKLTNATVPANTNLAVWFDVYIDRDAPAGDYTGTISLSKNNAEFATVPVQLHVYNFSLPDVSYLNNMFFFDPSQLSSRYGSSDRELENKYYEMAHRHLMDLNPVLNLNEIKQYFGSMLNGSWYTPANGYEGPGENGRHTMYSIGIYDLDKTGPTGGGRSGWSPVNQAHWTATAKAWVDYFNTNIKGVNLSRYMPDEPYWPPATRETGYAALQFESGLLKNSNTGLKSFCTAPIPDPRANPYCDINSGTDDFLNVGSIVSLQNQGKKVGFYNGLEPNYGEGLEHFNYNLTSPRVNPWVAERYNMDHYFLWETTFGYTNGNFDLYANPNVAGPGNALVFYPGIDNKSNLDPNIRGPIASIRIKGWRRGVQDNDYLQLAKAAGKGAQVTQMVTTVVPKAFNDVNRSQPPLWPEYGYQFENYRKQLAELLDSSTPQPTARPTTNPTTAPTTAPTVNPSTAPTVKPTTSECLTGDVDCSGKVNAVDLSILLAKFGSADTTADLDNSGKVNAIDISLLLTNFGKTN